MNSFPSDGVGVASSRATCALQCGVMAVIYQGTLHTNLVYAGTQSRPQPVQQSKLVLALVLLRFRLCCGTQSQQTVRLRPSLECWVRWRMLESKTGDARARNKRIQQQPDAEKANPLKSKLLCCTTTTTTTTTNPPCSKRDGRSHSQARKANQLQLSASVGKHKFYLFILPFHRLLGGHHLSPAPTVVLNFCAHGKLHL